MHRLTQLLNDEIDSWRSLAQFNSAVRIIFLPLPYIIGLGGDLQILVVQQAYSLPHASLKWSYMQQCSLGLGAYPSWSSHRKYICVSNIFSSGVYKNGGLWCPKETSIVRSQTGSDSINCFPIILGQNCGNRNYSQTRIQMAQVMEFLLVTSLNSKASILTCQQRQKNLGLAPALLIWVNVGRVL